MIPNFETLEGKNGYKWSSKAKVEGKIPGKNIVHIRPGPVAEVRQILDPLRIFQLFFSDDMLNKIVLCTNQEINRANKNYKVSTKTFSDTNLVELKALLGIYILAAAMKDNHLSSKMMFDTSYCGTRYRATMSKSRFDFLTACLRFDNKETRAERRNVTVFAPISEVWDEFIELCRTKYKPSSYVTIDEQLVGFRGHCPFRMYIPNKPAKYGLKLVLLCDVSTKYLINASPYVGKSTQTNGRPLADYFVELLTTPIYGTNRNVTMDNWFTNVPLADRLISRPYNLTIVGTIRKNKPHIPPALVEIDKNRQIGTSLFAYSSNSTLVSYKPKANKIVTLLSTMHTSSGTTNKDTKKPEIIHTYNATKGAVDTFDQMCQNMCANRKTKRWPMCIFYNMINVACINSYVIYSHNVITRGGKPITRQMYMLELHKELTEAHQTSRLQTVHNMSNDLKKIIEDVLGKKCEEKEAQGPENSNKGPRKYCHKCATAKKRMTTTYCLKCQKPICGEHQVKICPSCA